MLKNMLVDADEKFANGFIAQEEQLSIQHQQQKTLKELKREIHAPDSVADMQRAGDGLIMKTLHDLEDTAFEMLGSTKPITPQ